MVGSDVSDSKVGNLIVLFRENCITNAIYIIYIYYVHIVPIFNAYMVLVIKLYKKKTQITNV